MQILMYSQLWEIVVLLSHLISSCVLLGLLIRIHLFLSLGILRSAYLMLACLARSFSKLVLGLLSCVHVTTMLCVIIKANGGLVSS